ncbi:MAG: acyl-ACP thioesterase [Spirochaetaceae bacterium]|jgi:acyl-ACP thioesterase|nr:acyl-ACP thioesterase [Spirochaetaceae bacterium]
MDVWQETVAVTLGDVDSSNRVKPSAFFAYFQHATTLHGDDLGIGAGTIAEVGQGWVLSRFSVEIEKRPAMSETLTLRTWPRGFKKLFAIRDYELIDGSGGLVARARSGWLVIDIHKRRPLREESLHTKLPANDAMPDMIPGGPFQLGELAGMEKAGEKTASYSDTDYNGHVNNVRYIEWLEDCIGLDRMLAASKISININYVNELLPGQTVGLFKQSDGSRTAVMAQRQEDGQCVFRAEMCIQ